MRFLYNKGYKREKKNKLNENIKKLEILSKNINESINTMKEIFLKINEKKEELKKKIQMIFTKIRNALNDREDEIILDIDKKYDEIYFKEDLIKEIEKLPNKIKIYLEKGKTMNNEWNDENKLSLIINDCINIENNIKNINYIEECIKNYNKNNYSKIYIFPNEEKTINLFLKNIKKFEILNSNSIFKSSKIIDKNIFIESIINWINKGNINMELLYRLTITEKNFQHFMNFVIISVQ